MAYSTKNAMIRIKELLVAISSQGGFVLITDKTCITEMAWDQIMKITGKLQCSADIPFFLFFSGILPFVQPMLLKKVVLKGQK